MSYRCTKYTPSGQPNRVSNIKVLQQRLLDLDLISNEKQQLNIKSKHFESDSFEDEMNNIDMKG